MAEKRMCPHCGSQMFMVKTIRAGLAEFTTDPNEPCKILKENKDKFDIEIVGCARCKANVEEADLVTGVKCKECGRIVGPMDINAEGICNVCEAVKQRAELANASREDLIKMLLDAEKKTNPVAAKMEKQIEKAEEFAPAPTSGAKVEATDETVAEETPTETVAEEGKPKRRSTRRKKADDEPQEKEESVEEESVVESEAVAEDTENAVNDIANQQEAPFPDLGDAMNPPVAEESAPMVETPVIPEPVQGEQAIGTSDFNMFDDGEEPF